MLSMAAEVVVPVSCTTAADQVVPFGLGDSIKLYKQALRSVKAY